jgi:hypothetical protein
MAEMQEVCSARLDLTMAAGSFLLSWMEEKLYEHN